MKKSEILERLDLGNAVAENDENLERYFVPTVALDDFLSDRYDLVRGAKGSGKSAILRMVSSGAYPQLKNVALITATEHMGEPAFKRAFEKILLDKVDDVSLTNAWKAYIINLALDAVERLPASTERSEAIALAEKCGIRYRTTSLFKKIWWSALRMLHIKSFEVGADSVSAEFPDEPPEFWTKSDTAVDFPEILRLIVAALNGAGVQCWILMDRLDAAFQDKQELERRALRSLLIAYKDFMGHKALRVKLFFRTDLYDTVTANHGFRELTHVADRASPPITWDPDKLMQMLMERFAFNTPVCDLYGFSKSDIADADLRTAAFFSIFPDQIDVGKRKGDSWGWICSRIRDGNNTRTPRDLHRLVVASAQKEREQLALGRSGSNGELISAVAVRAGLEEMSKDKVRTTLLAENPELEIIIRKFQNQKSEQNAETLAALLGDDWLQKVEQLARIGFLEKLPESWKIPIIYRDGLSIVQGAAFPKNKTGLADEE
jgi:hypothetical protein